MKNESNEMAEYIVICLLNSFTTYNVHKATGSQPHSSTQCKYKLFSEYTLNVIKQINK